MHAIKIEPRPRRLAAVLAMTLLTSSILVAGAAAPASAFTCGSWHSFSFTHRDGVARTEGRYSRNCTDAVVYVEGTVWDTLNDDRSARAQVVYDNGRKSTWAIAGGGVGSSAPYSSFTGPPSLGFKVCLHARNTWGGSWNDCRRV